MRLSVHLSSPIPWKIKEKHHCHRYIIDIVIHVIVNWQLSKQGIHWPVSHDDIVVSLRVTCFFFSSRQLPRYWFTIGSQAQARLLLWGKEGACTKTTFENWIWGCRDIWVICCPDLQTHDQLVTLRVNSINNTQSIIQYKFLYFLIHTKLFTRITKFLHCKFSSSFISTIKTDISNLHFNTQWNMPEVPLTTILW